MAQLLVRDVDASVVEALEQRAARNGRSAEAEHRAILRAVLLEKSARNLKQHLLAMPDVGDDADFEAPRPPATYATSHGPASASSIRSVRNVAKLVHHLDFADSRYSTTTSLIWITGCASV